MKIVLAPITNSSATAYLMLFKGDKIDLFKELLDQRDAFDVQFNSYNNQSFQCDVVDFIRSIDECVKSGKGDLWLKPSIEKVENKISRFKEQLVEQKEFLRLAKVKENYEGEIKYTQEEVDDIEKRISRFENHLDSGMIHFLEITFGDNDGMIQGGRVGTTFDYMSSDIMRSFKDTNDIKIWTEARR